MSESILEFKRKFILQNLSDMKKEWLRTENYRDQLRFWFLMIWFGTASLFLKDNNKINISYLLIIETSVFYLFDIFLSFLNRYRLERISKVEHQIMSNPIRDFINLEGPLTKWADKDGFSRKTLNKNFIINFFKIFLNPYNLVLYLSFFILSIFFRNLI